MIDFLVIGGGIAGISTAARLSALGSVAVLEGEDALGYHASGRSAALFEENYGAPSVVALNTASHDHLKNGEYLSPRGILLIGTAETADAFAADQAYLKLSSVTMTEASDMMPILGKHIDRAAFHASATDIDTDRLQADFAKTVRGNGGTITTRAMVTAITKTRVGWQVTTKDQTYDAKVVVNAGGAWADQIAKMAGIAPVGLQPLRRSMGRIPAPNGMDVSNWPMTFGPGEDWYCKPDAGALIVSPADETPVDPHDAFADDMTLAEGFARFESMTTHEVTRLLSSWAGLRTFAPDRTLVLGPAPADQSFIWVAGQGGYGFSSCASASQLIADLISGVETQIDKAAVAALSPARFT